MKNPSSLTVLFTQYSFPKSFILFLKSIYYPITKQLFDWNIFVIMLLRIFKIIFTNGKRQNYIIDVYEFFEAYLYNTVSSKISKITLVTARGTVPEECSIALQVTPKLENLGQSTEEKWQVKLFGN